MAGNTIGKLSELDPTVISEFMFLFLCLFLFIRERGDVVSCMVSVARF